jgi:D-alanyl-lipoteichoic acid acyltransferase DltB (MBOAT superfamily)
MPSIVFNTNRNNLDIVARGKYLPTIKEFFAIGITFSLTVFAWIFFRAANVKHAFSYISEIFSSSLLTIPHFPGIGKAVLVVFLMGIFIIIEWLGREQEYAFKIISNIRLLHFRVILYYAVILSILFFGNFNENQFIYFQF